MFKLESYITPIILSYVDKYVKNARADRSQVSFGEFSVQFLNSNLKEHKAPLESVMMYTIFQTL